MKKEELLDIVKGCIVREGLAKKAHQRLGKYSLPEMEAVLQNALNIDGGEGLGMAQVAAINILVARGDMDENGNVI